MVESTKGGPSFYDHDDGYELSHSGFYHRISVLQTIIQGSLTYLS